MIFRCDSIDEIVEDLLNMCDVNVHVHDVRQSLHQYMTARMIDPEYPKIIMVKLRDDMTSLDSSSRPYTGTVEQWEHADVVIGPYNYLLKDVSGQLGFATPEQLAQAVEV